MAKNRQIQRDPSMYTFFDLFRNDWVTLHRYDADKCEGGSAS